MTLTVPSLYTRNTSLSSSNVKLDHAIANVSRDDLTLWLSGPESSTARPMPDGWRPEPGGSTFLEVEDLVSRIAELKQAGIHFCGEIVGGPESKKILVEDPDQSGGAV